MVKSNYHTHSVFSDGENTLEEIAEAALKKGFVALGFSDHSPISFDDSFCMPYAAYEKYKRNISRLKAVYSGRLDILCGLELDYYSDGFDTDDLDYTVGSVHYVKSGGIYYSVDDTPQTGKKGIDEGFGGDACAYAAAYYKNLCGHMQNNRVDIVGHFDLVTIFGLVDEENPVYRRAALEAAEYAAELEIPIEINTGAVFKHRKKNPYPADFILKYFCAKGGSVVIDSDAHIAANLDFYFEEACEYLKSSGFKTAIRFRKDGPETYYL